MSFKIVALSFFVGIFLTGCLFTGTGTGNPFSSHLGTGSSTLTNLIAEDVCMSIVRCHASSERVACRKETWPMTTFAERLGVSEAVMLEEIDRREAQGLLRANTTAAQKCREAVRAVACDDPVMVAAFDSASSTPFAVSAAVLAPICVDVFGK